MPVQLGAKGQPGFEEPIDLMMDCHRRIEHFLSVLQRVAEQSDGCHLDEPSRRGVQAALRYFREAAPNHTADEEHSLFPRLREIDSEFIGALLDEADRLEAQHRDAEQLHGRVELAFDRWLTCEIISSDALHALRQDLRALGELYQEHIRYEDEVLFPVSQRLLDKEDKRDIGREMERRRRPQAPAGETH